MATHSPAPAAAPWHYEVVPLSSAHRASVDPQTLAVLQFAAFAAETDDYVLPTRGQLASTVATWSESFLQHNSTHPLVWLLFARRAISVRDILVGTAALDESIESGWPLQNFYDEEHAVEAPPGVAGARWRHLHIDLVAVLPRHKGRGNGARLLAALEEAARQRLAQDLERFPVVLTLVVEPAHRRARALYERSGFAHWTTLENGSSALYKRVEAPASTTSTTEPGARRRRIDLSGSHVALGAEASLCHCGKRANLECGRCHAKFYCSPECQRSNWIAAHERECAQK